MKSKSSSPSRYKSKFEAKVAELYKSKGIVAKYETQRLAYRLDCYYTPDWELPSGILVETKGKFDSIARRKMAAAIAQNPTKDIRMMFMRNNKLSKKSNTTYGQWCDKRGIKWSVYPELPF